MYISALSLFNFRNYEWLEFEPGNGLNVLFGQNAQGKSGIVEAIYMLATSKSHRTSKDVDMIKLGEQTARVKANVNRTHRADISVEIILDRTEKKSVRINTVKHPKIGDIVGQLNAVVFSATDLDMVKGDPSRRRRFLNLEVAQISPQYVYSLGRYKRVLDQRNNLLREIKYGGASEDGLELWDNQLADYGAAVMIRRREFGSRLAVRASAIYNSLSDACEDLSVAYRPNLDMPKDATEQEISSKYLSMLAAKRQFDISRGTTTSGPHRDDISLSINKTSAREYASQGQQRSIAIALKLAEIELIEESVGESPIVLLDDVMAELDEARRRKILNITCGKCQTLVTTTHLSDIDESLIGNAKIFEVKSGQVMAK